MDTALGILAYVGALALTAIASLLLALFVALRARALPGATLLILFLAGVALWSIGQAVPAVIGPASVRFTTIVIALSPLPAAAFVHLVFAYALSPAERPVAMSSYAIAAFATLVGLIFGVGEVIAWRAFPGFFVPSIVGWGVLGVAGILSLAGHFRLLQAWAGQQGQQRDQARSVFISSGLGLVALSGFVFPALNIPFYPWPVLLLPLYSVALVYGIIRHRFMVADVWAQRGLIWLLLLSGAGAASALIAALPLTLAGRPAGFFATWAALAATLLLGLALLAPLKRLVDRLVFPGGRITESDMSLWRDRLADATGERELSAAANAILRQRLGLPDDGPGLTVSGEAVTLTGWDEAPVAARHLADRVAILVGEAARRLSAAHRLVETEREARLAELGALAATVAHDLRNPLGIITMAATGAPAEVRAEIGEQVGRMNHLITDILDYAKAWTVTPRDIEVEALASRFGIEGEIAPGMTVHADPMALNRALENLIDNVSLVERPGWSTCFRLSFGEHP